MAEFYRMLTESYERVDNRMFQWKKKQTITFAFDVLINSHNAAKKQKQNTGADERTRNSFIYCYSSSVKVRTGIFCSKSDPDPKTPSRNRLSVTMQNKLLRIKLSLPNLDKALQS